MRRITTALVILAVAVAGGCAGDEATVSAAGGGAGVTQPPGAATAAPAQAGQTPSPDATTGPRPIPVDDTVPVRVRIPAIGIDSALETLYREDDGRLAAPADWQSAGWFAGGPVPGAPGPAVIAGHVDSPSGAAVFAGLARLRPGDQVEVELSDGSVSVFEVDGSRTVPQADFPTDEVYGPVPDRQLRLITCHTFDEAAGHYTDNLVVFATATG
ncbi:sortase domain-containing protein [Jiangella alkaliphila]|uniref:LPXTG-site transpeptidase (Sortase) family protein n=1 Tax=Jiangella alkaliphila TaxID=419479 RepID=A0A1H2IE25_9ACTN|nr:sortase [Jiangella alkaliphila]SDU42098.1 LPXTG-site transpeptidase (sortase) family protein [Jiangella alkaliphila]